MNWIQRFLTAITTHKTDASAHHAQVHGAAQHTDVTRAIFLAAGEGFVETGTYKESGGFPYASGGADLDEPVAHNMIRVPDDYVSLVSVKAVWASPVASGNMYWILAASWVRADEARTEEAPWPPVATATGGANIFNVQVPTGAELSLLGLQAGDFLGLHFYREGSDPLDTLNNPVKFYGLLFTYVAKQ